MQSSNVVRGSIQSECSLPLMRSVIGTAPSMFGPALAGGESLSPAVLFADAGTYAATKLAATPLPEVKRNLRRVGLGGRDLGSSSDIGPPFWTKQTLEFHVPYACSRMSNPTTIVGRLPLARCVAYDAPTPSARSFASTKGTSTRCSLRNQICNSLVRITSLTTRSLVPSSPSSAARRANGRDC